MIKIGKKDRLPDRMPGYDREDDDYTVSCSAIILMSGRVLSTLDVDDRYEVIHYRVEALESVATFSKQPDLIVMARCARWLFAYLAPCFLYQFDHRTSYQETTQRRIAVHTHDITAFAFRWYRYAMCDGARSGCIQESEDVYLSRQEAETIGTIAIFRSEPIRHIPMEHSHKQSNTVGLNAKTTSLREIVQLTSASKNRQKHNYAYSRLIDRLTTEDQVRYAIWAVRQVLHLFDERYPEDSRPRKAIEAAEACLAAPRICAHALKSAQYAYTAANVQATIPARVAYAAYLAANTAARASNRTNVASNTYAAVCAAADAAEWRHYHVYMEVIAPAILNCGLALADLKGKK